MLAAVLVLTNGGSRCVLGDAVVLEPDRTAEAGSSQFRGTLGQGHSIGLGLAVHWNESTNIAWKVPVPGLGWSSPVIQDGRIWLTTALDDGRSLRAVCLAEATGKVIHDVEVFHKQTPGKIHPRNSHATPTPYLDGDRIFVHFGAHGTACLDRDGRVLWKAELPYYHHHGPSASPVLVQGRLIIPCDGFGGPFYDRITRPGVNMPQFVVALDSATGEVAWKQGRDGWHSYATPLVIEVKGVFQVVCPGAKRVVAYNPATGEELWSCRYGNGYSLVPRPVFGHGLVYVCTGYDSATLLAIRPDGTGDVTGTHVTWKVTQGVPLNSSPVLDGDQLYLVSDGGVATCLNAKTGARHWQGRLGGNFSASLLLADGHLYACSETGVTHVVVPATGEYKRLATNKLEGRLFASPAVSGKSIYLRTDHHLYRIEAPEK